MELTTLGPLRVRRVTKTGPTRENDAEKMPLMCVLLHGFGAGGDDLVGLADRLDVPVGTRFVFPEALLSLRDVGRFGDARAWWLIDFARLERSLSAGEIRDLTGDVPAGLTEARAAMTELLDSLTSSSASSGEPSRLVVGGFSQGAMLSMDVALREPARPIAGVIQLSGTLLAAREWTPLMAARRGTPVFQSHGRMDPILPFSIAEQLRDALVGAGLDVTFEGFAGPHTITEENLERLGVWLRALP